MRTTMTRQGVTVPVDRPTDLVLVVALVALVVITLTGMILVATSSMKALDASTLTIGPLVLLGFVIGSRIVRH